MNTSTWPAVARGRGEGYFKRIEGVKGTTRGYASSRRTENRAMDVCRHDTGHAETVKVDTMMRLSVRRFAYILFRGDPVSVNKQGNDGYTITEPEYIRMRVSCL